MSEKIKTLVKDALNDENPNNNVSSMIDDHN